MPNITGVQKLGKLRRPNLSALTEDFICKAIVTVGEAWPDGFRERLDEPLPPFKP